MRSSIRVSLPWMHSSLQRQLKHAQALPQPSRRRTHDRAGPAVPHVLLPHPRAPALVLQPEQPLILPAVLAVTHGRRPLRRRGSSCTLSTRTHQIALDGASPHPRSPSCEAPRVHRPGVPLRRRAPQRASSGVLVRAATAGSGCWAFRTILAQPPVSAPGPPNASANPHPHPHRDLGP